MIWTGVNHGGERIDLGYYKSANYNDDDYPITLVLYPVYCAGRVTSYQANFDMGDIRLEKDIKVSDREAARRLAISWLYDMTARLNAGIGELKNILRHIGEESSYF